MRDRSTRISKLLENRISRESYIRSKLNVLLPSQIRALRLRRQMKQEELGSEADMKQSRISAMERPGETKFNIETLIRLAAAFRVGLKVEFVPFSDMLQWENGFSQDSFDATRLDDDIAFTDPDAAVEQSLAKPEESHYEGVGLAKAAAGGRSIYQELDPALRFMPSPEMLTALQGGGKHARSSNSPC